MTSEQHPNNPQRSVMPSDWVRWTLMAVLAGVAVYFFFFNNAATRDMPVPPEGAVTDPLLADAIQQQLARIDEKPESLDRRMALCMLYHGNDLQPTAQACYEMITEAVPQYPRAWYHLAQVLGRQGDAAGAMQAMRTAADQGPKEPFPHWQLGLMLIETDRPEEALPYLESARETLSDEPLLISAIARALIASGDPAAGIELIKERQLEESTQAGPYAQYLLAQAYDATSQPQAAEAARALAADQPPATIDSWMLSVINARRDLPTLRQRIARAVRSQEWSQARELIEILRQYEVFNDETLMLEATILARTGAPEEALQILDGLSGGNANSTVVALSRANVELEIATARQDLAFAQSALATAEEILEAEPQSVPAHAICMRAYDLLGQPAEAIASCRAAFRMGPNNPLPLQLAAVLIARHELWKDNEDLLRELWDRAPEHAAAGPMLVLSLSEQGRNAEARQILAELKQASLDPNLLSRARTAAEAAP